MYTVQVRIKGVTPLLMNKFVEKEANPQKRGEEEDTPELAKEKVYRNDKGEIIVPAEMILRAMDKVSSEYKIEGMKKTTAKSLLPGNIFIEPEGIKIEPQNFVVDKRTVVIPATRGRVIRYRPKFPEWKLEFKIHIFDDRIKPEILQHILSEAGRRAGIGDGRKIGFGRFVIEQFSKI